MLDQINESITQMSKGKETLHSMGIRVNSSVTLGALAMVQAMAGQPERGLATLDKALTFVEETSERH